MSDNLASRATCGACFYAWLCYLSATIVALASLVKLGRNLLFICSNFSRLMISLRAFKESSVSIRETKEGVRGLWLTVCVGFGYLDD